MFDYFRNYPAMSIKFAVKIVRLMVKLNFPYNYAASIVNCLGILSVTWSARSIPPFVLIPKTRRSVRPGGVVVVFGNAFMERGRIGLRTLCLLLI